MGGVGRQCADFLVAAGLTCVPPSVVADVDTSMNSMSGQSSDWLPYLVVKKPTASRPMLDVRGPSPRMAYLRHKSIGIWRPRFDGVLDPCKPSAPATHLSAELMLTSLFCTSDTG